MISLMTSCITNDGNDGENQINESNFLLLYPFKTIKYGITEDNSALIVAILTAGILQFVMY